MSRAITEDEIRNLPAVVGLADAARALGISVNHARELSRLGKFPVETIPIGKRQKVSKHKLLVHLGLRPTNSDPVAGHDAPSAPRRRSRRTGGASSPAIDATH